MDTRDFITQIDSLINVYESLRGRSQHDDLSDLEDDSKAIVVRLRAAITRLVPGPNPYTHEMQAVEEDPIHVRIPVYVGILRALKADIAEGWMTGVAELLHASTFDDFLDQSNELLVKGYKDPAAVVAGSALEAHIHLLCARHGVGVHLPGGQPKKADTMNADLVKAGAYNGLQAKSVTAWLGIRNASAHGDYGQYDKNQVRGMVDAVRDFISRHPA